MKKKKQMSCLWFRDMMCGLFNSLHGSSQGSDEEFDHFNTVFIGMRVA